MFVCVIEKHICQVIAVYRPTLLSIHGLCPQVNLSISGHLHLCRYLLFDFFAFIIRKKTWTQYILKEVDILFRVWKHKG